MFFRIIIILCSLCFINISSMIDPPPPADVAKMARYIVHNSDWTSLSFILLQGNFKGYPSSRIFSMADGTITRSTGIPYLYASALDQGIEDLNTDNRCTLSMTLAQSMFCSQHHYDPEDPRCAQVVLTGNFETLKPNTTESLIAEKALFSRHPEMKMWPSSHHFQFKKLNIKEISVLDFFGGIKTVLLDDYYKANPDTPSVEHII